MSDRDILESLEVGQSHFILGNVRTFGWNLPAVTPTRHVDPELGRGILYVCTGPKSSPPPTEQQTEERGSLFSLAPSIREAEQTEWLIETAARRAVAMMGQNSRATLPEAPLLPAPDAPESHFADLMLADETTDDAKARLSQRLRELRHYLIAPEIRVNEDGSLGLTSAEQSELQDLERRQTLGRWLEA